MKTGYTYIMSNKLRTVFYIGVTNDIERRVLEHKAGIGSSFSNRYQCYYLIHFEQYYDISEAIIREKQLKKWNRQWKINLISENNPKIIDLAIEWYTAEQISIAKEEYSSTVR